MTLIEVRQPVSLKTASCTFTLEGEEEYDFSSHISQVELTPTVSSSSWTPINGRAIQSSSAATWSAVLSLVQDMAQTGFLRWLQEHEGKKAEMKATFADGTDPLQITVNITPAKIGGTADGSTLQSSVTIACDGTPRWLTVEPPPENPDETPNPEGTE